MRPRDTGPSDETLQLLITPGLGPATLRRLREHFGDDAAVVAARETHLRAVRGIGAQGAAALRSAMDAADPARERRLLAEHAARIVLAGDPQFPPLLAAIPDPPAALWVRGELEPDSDQLALAVVGSRRCTAWGRDQAMRFGGLMATSGFTVVSGGAAGIDAAAHRGALRGGGRTVAVMGCGLGVVYPPEHRDLFDDIVKAGGVLVSEYPLLAPPVARHFPRRNRIISGLSLGVLVVEAARRSGALITARLAAEEHGREVMVVPGRADSTACRGGLEAARDGWAGLVMSHLDVLHQLESAGQLVRGALEAAGVLPAGGGDRPAVRLTDVQQAIVDAARGHDAFDADRLAEETGMTLGRLLAEITKLEILGVKVR